MRLLEEILAAPAPAPPDELTLAPALVRQVGQRWAAQAASPWRQYSLFEQTTRGYAESVALQVKTFPDMGELMAGVQNDWAVAHVTRDAAVEGLTGMQATFMELLGVPQNPLARRIALEVEAARPLRNDRLDVFAQPDNFAGLHEKTKDVLGSRTNWPVNFQPAAENACRYLSGFKSFSDYQSYFSSTDCDIAALRAEKKPGAVKLANHAKFVRDAVRFSFNCLTAVCDMPGERNAGILAVAWQVWRNKPGAVQARRLE